MENIYETIFLFFGKINVIDIHLSVGQAKNRALQMTTATDEKEEQETSHTVKG